MKDDILRAMDPGGQTSREPEPRLDPPPAAPLATEAGGTAGAPLRVTPELLRTAASALEGLRGEFGTAAVPPGESADGAASGLPGWECAAALQYVAQRWRSQSANLSAVLTAGATKLAEGARTYKETDERAADDFANSW